ncbi:RNA polymerase recycling motor ATPase HelR [Microbacterium sp.]|uniref:RNA polymerase recycling motor ATPase HelR n=1 Tax=Microbacterium sp. TaxID=51671 RepID=UPI003340B09B
MPRTPDTFFALPSDRTAKSDIAFTAADDARLAEIAATIDADNRRIRRRLDELRRRAVRAGAAALERDQNIRALSTRLRVRERFGADLCLGRIVPDDGSDPVYIGRLGLTGADGRQLLVDWRAPAAEPFFGATHAEPMGTRSRRRFRWAGGTIRDYWDEAFTEAGLADAAVLDDRSAFIASLAESRTSRMRDVLGTIQADQDAIIRAGAGKALVVDGGPGTGKTVVALHRASYLLYADPRVDERGILFIGPHEPYLSYIADVLPGLGEDGVRACTLRDLVAEGVRAAPEEDSRIAALKADVRMVEAIEPAVRLYEEPPVVDLAIETEWADLEVSAADWADAFAAAEPGVPHNEARDQVWQALVEILRTQAEEQVGDDVPLRALQRQLARHPLLTRTFARAWPLLEASALVADLWAVPAYLRRCAPWLDADGAGLLRRPRTDAWTDADLPLIDAARHRLGDPDGARLRRRREAALAEQCEYMGEVVEAFVSAGHEVMQWMNGADLRNSLIDESALPEIERDALAGPFAHIVVDEAQELTDAEWRMLLRRCPSRSLTVVGDRAQARQGFAETWGQRLRRIGIPDADQRSLTINYRTPEEIMTAAEPVIRAAFPDANVPVSVRRSSVPVRRGRAGDLDEVLDEWLRGHPDGTACVIGAARGDDPAGRVRSLTPVTAKGLEFDLVVLVDPLSFGTGIRGAVDRYVSMTRATGELVVLDEA